VLSENVLHAVDTLLVPMIPATLSVRTFDQLASFVSDFDGAQPRVRAFFSMVDRRSVCTATWWSSCQPKGREF